MMRAVAAAYRDAGYRVIGAAPTARAARELRDVANIPAGTLHTLAAELDRTRGFRESTVLLLDEAAMASTRISAKIFAHADRAGAKVIAVGDPGQLTSVDAGGWLAAITRQHAGPELRQVIRQHDPAERDALEALHDGHPETYLEHKAEHITIHATQNDALAAVIDQWADARAVHGHTAVAMIARDNPTREQLNDAARDRLKTDGGLPHRGVLIGGRELAPGDRIITRRNDRQLDIDNGTLATITGFDHQRRAVLITIDAGRERATDATYLAHHVEHAYAITGHSSQGATVDSAIIVARPEEYTREWAYTALSRARQETTIHLIADHGPAEHDRREYAPALPDREPGDAIDALTRAMRKTQAELLASEHGPAAGCFTAPTAGPPAIPLGPPTATRAQAGRAESPAGRGERQARSERRRSDADASLPRAAQEALSGRVVSGSRRITVVLSPGLRRLDPGGADGALHPLPRSACGTIRPLGWDQRGLALAAMLGDIRLDRPSGRIPALARSSVDRSGADRLDHVVGRMLGNVTDTVRGATTVAAVALAPSSDHLNRPLIAVAPPCLDLHDPCAQLLDAPLGRGLKLLDAFGGLLEATRDLGWLAPAPERRTVAVAVANELELAALHGLDLPGDVSNERGGLLQALWGL